MGIYSIASVKYYEQGKWKNLIMTHVHRIFISIFTGQVTSATWWSTAKQIQTAYKENIT